MDDLAETETDQPDLEELRRQYEEAADDRDSDAELARGGGEQGHERPRSVLLEVDGSAGPGRGAALVRACGRGRQLQRHEQPRMAAPRADGSAGSGHRTAMVRARGRRGPPPGQAQP